ncbi:NADH:ubiquinone oxidoreductase subunit 39 [Arctopsyche grandis]|uniref:NADH:ubiquinone oxidoreductase subunit 39 n=1 Tax=Arctopsyche grandis TaxID=121162 RepID=UPI00406D9358
MSGAGMFTSVSVLRAPLRRAIENQVGSCSVVYVQNSSYSTDVKKINVSAWKRGTGGRSSFNGVVATVFGCTGLVGRTLCNRLGKIGTQLILPYRCDHYDCMRLKGVGDLGQVLFQQFDIRDQESVERAVKYSNVVFNLIGRDYETKNFSYDDVHVKSAVTIARACKKAGVERLIHLSYLNSAEDPEPLAMKKPSGFKISKWRGEQAIRNEFPDVTILKASDIYGTADRFIEAFASPVRRQFHFMPLWHNGEDTQKQPVYVSDVAQGLVNAAKESDTIGKTYLAVGPKRYKLDDLVDWFFVTMRRDSEWGYVRYDMRYDPFFQIRVSLNDVLSPAYPIGYLHWEGIEREATSDDVTPGVPTLDDLGVTLTQMEDIVPWLLKPHRAFAYYNDILGDHEFTKPVPPPTIPIN